MTIVFEERTLGDVPALLARPADARGPLPAVLWYHGFAAGKDAHRAELARAASLGALAVGVDAVGHGARRLPDWDARMDAGREAVRRTMRALASATADEIPSLLARLAGSGLADARGVAVVGISMGAFVAYRAPAVAPAVRTVVALLGTTAWPDDGAPVVAPEAFDGVALLTITAERDVNVPPGPARRFHGTLVERRGGDDGLRHVELAGAEHLMTGEQWETAMAETMRWIAARLVGSR